VRFLENEQHILLLALAFTLQIRPFLSFYLSFFFLILRTSSRTVRIRKGILIRSRSAKGQEERRTAREPRREHSYSADLIGPMIAPRGPICRRDLFQEESHPASAVANHARAGLSALSSAVVKRWRTVSHNKTGSSQSSSRSRRLIKFA